MVGAAGVVAITYFLAARLGLALLSADSDVAVFWPASGVAAGILITFGPRTRPALVIGVVVGTVAAGLLSDRRLLTSIFNGSWNAGEAVLVAWLLERWFGQSFTFVDLRRVAGFLVAAGLATAVSGVGGAVTMTLLHPETTAPYWDVWREWFLSSWVGLVVVAPLVIGTAQTWHKPPSREEWIEAVGVLGLTVVACSYTMAQKTGSWLSFSPSAFVLPLLLWLTARCQPTFAIAGAFLASVAIICATTFGIGRFGDAAVPVMQRVTGAQLAMMTVTLFTLVLAVLFAQRKKAEKDLRQSERQLAKERTMLARLHEVGSRLWLKRDLGQALEEILAGAIQLLDADKGTIRILDTTRGVLKIEAQRGFTSEFLDCFGVVPADGGSPCCRALRSAERIVIADVEADDLFSPFRPIARAAGYRAAQSTPIMSREGARLGTLATHFRQARKPSDEDLRLLDLYVRQAADIIERHRAEDALREREERLRLAQLKTGIGVWDRNLRTGKMTVTPELEALLGLGSMKGYEDFRARVHPDDIATYEAERDAAVRRKETFETEYRIIRPDGQIRWLVTRGGAVYDEVTGEPIRLVGNDADITEHKLAELALAERNAQLLLAGKDAGVGCYANNIKTGLIAVTEGYVAIHGLPEGTTQTTLSQWRTKVHPDDLAQFDELRQQIFDSRRRDYMFDSRTLRVSLSTRSK
jgi:PAS domain S-box-containing protein